MALCGEEFFSKCRSFASTLDKDCNELKSKIENDEISSGDEGRSHLILREILADAQKFKDEVNVKVSQIKESFSFEEVFTACERLSEHTKTQIDELEEHLFKYGYKSPGQLPTVDSINTNDDKSESSSTMETDDSDGFHNNSQSNGDVNDMETDKILSNDDDDVSGCSALQKKIQEDDLMSTPVKPDTFTPMIQATPTLLSTQNEHPCIPDQSPVPPQTTTPMINTKTQSQVNTNILHSPPNNTPPPPTTFTPLLKTYKAQGINRQIDEQPNCIGESPLPPMLNTPGLKMMRVPGHGDYMYGVDPMQTLDSTTDDFDSPMPPDLTCSVLLKPEDLMAHHGQISTNQPDKVTEEEYSHLPVYIKNHFSLHNINTLLWEINQFFKHQPTESNSICEDVFRDVFNLGHKSKAFMLALEKLGRVKVENGMVVFKNKEPF